MRLTRVLILLTGLAAAFVLMPPPEAHAGLPTSGVEVRTGTTPAVTALDTEVSLELPHTGPTKLLQNVAYQLGGAPTGVKVSICRLDEPRTCHEVTGSTSGKLVDWKGQNTASTYAVVLIAPGAGGATLPTPGFSATLKLFYN